MFDFSFNYGLIGSDDYLIFVAEVSGSLTSIALNNLLLANYSKEMEIK
jgi:hypothetical protein